MPAAAERTIRVALMAHRDTGLLIATSDDLKGLFLAGRSEDEIERQLPGAIREILEAEGNEVLSLISERDHDRLPETFVAFQFVANARLQARAA